MTLRCQGEAAAHSCTCPNFTSQRGNVNKMSSVALTMRLHNASILSYILIISNIILLQQAVSLVAICWDMDRMNRMERMERMDMLQYVGICCVMLHLPGTGLSPPC